MSNQRRALLAIESPAVQWCKLIFVVQLASALAERLFGHVQLGPSPTCGFLWLTAAKPAEALSTNLTTLELPAHQHGMTEGFLKSTWKWVK